MSGAPPSDEKAISISRDASFASASAENEGSPSSTAKETQRIMRKLDWELMPICSLLYLASFIDRTAIGNAKIAGLLTDLRMSSDLYAVALSVFFVLYAFLEVPSNLALRRFGAKVWLPIIILIWGVTMTLSGLVQNAAGLIVTRIVLGGAEGGMFPGIALLLSFCYPRAYIQLRIGIFWSFSAVSGAFGGLLAFGLTRITTNGFNGWRWLFITEGLLTCAIAVLAYFTLISGIDDSKHLTQTEKEYLHDQVDHDGTDIPMNDQFRWSYVTEGIFDWKVWTTMIPYYGLLANVYGTALVLPTLLKVSLGYDAIHAQLLTVPVYAVAAVVTIVFAYLSDRFHNRSIFIFLGSLISGVGWIMGYAASDAKVRYAGCFFSAMGSYAGFPSVVAILSQNSGPKTKRGVSLATQVGFGAFSGVVSSNVFLDREAPRFKTGYLVQIALAAAGCVGALVNAYLLLRANRNKQRRIDSGEAAKLSRQELADLGDRSPHFKYRI